MLQSREKFRGTLKFMGFVRKILQRAILQIHCRTILNKTHKNPRNKRRANANPNERYSPSGGVF